MKMHQGIFSNGAFKLKMAKYLAKYTIKLIFVEQELSYNTPWFCIAMMLKMHSNWYFTEPPFLQGEFADDGTETHFGIRDHNCHIKAVSSGKRREGIIHTLFIDGQEFPECIE